MFNTILDSFMERSVIPSFSSIGSFARSRLFQWQPLEQLSLENKVVVLTGGTSGIGLAGAGIFAKLGATLVLVARDKDKTDGVIKTIQAESGHPAIHSVIGDLGSLDDVRHIAEELAGRFPVIDVLIHNAGALYNERRRAANGTDLSVELMVSAPFLLNGLLLPQLNGKDRAPSHGAGRVLTMSSGGMYTEGLHTDTLQMPDESYQGARQYARAKRAQVILNELWAGKINPASTVFHALHPGWVSTPGITDALPGFSKILTSVGLLRSPQTGADTMVWLSANENAGQCSGLFWHDRAIRRIDMTRKTKVADTALERKKLWAWCERQTGWSHTAD